MKSYKKSIIKAENIDKIYLSSTMIREKIIKGESIEQFIDKEAG